MGQDRLTAPLRLAEGREEDAMFRAVHHTRRGFLRAAAGIGAVAWRAPESAAQQVKGSSGAESRGSRRRPARSIASTISTTQAIRSTRPKIFQDDAEPDDYRAAKTRSPTTLCC
jgi:hypothetical protein